MDQDFAQIGFLVAVISVVIILLVLLLVNLLLTVRNRRMRHQAEIQQVLSTQREQIAGIRMEVAEATLGDVSRDLHDEVGQLLTFSVLQLENLPMSPQEKQPQVVEEIKKSVRDALDAIRSISKGLSPDFIHQQGLIRSIEQLLERAQSRTGVKTSLFIAEGFHLSNSHHSIIIFRIIRECLTNSLRHGKASRITVGMTSSPNRIEISIMDNGIGINAEPGTKASLGFRNMQHYASLMSGSLTMTSSPEKGTEILLTIPNNREEHGHPDSISR
jgi:signal transduction histidine kinase